MIGDAFNNLAHSVDVKRDEDVTFKNKYFGIKKRMALHIIDECKRVGNEAYGLSEDESNNRPIFVVDIPQVGQIKWHFKNGHDITCKNYELKISNYRGKIDNQSLLCQEYSYSVMKTLDENTLKVIESENVPEMMNKLYNKEKNISLVEELKQKVISPEEALKSKDSTSVFSKQERETEEPTNEEPDEPF
ncbi:MAG: hypothetical protein IKV94_00195 [Clostridia bacterium]|nr:hypothetical protein [Clostridia bacterium]